ncbi:fungal specific transcription factor domain-containing protein [Aspergillus stella-maris]|uniref:fungal specific transcription factor domain-containing protein n=1 Tax=Aspergillus stella-maris TaxID=1810926 RepID=UPI003CCDE67D
MGLICCYPGPDKAPRRPHKTTISDVLERVARLERTVRALSRDSALDDSHHDLSMPLYDYEGSPGNHESGSGILVRGKHSSHYFDEILLSRVLDEELEMQHMLANGAPIRGNFPDLLEMSRVLFTSPAAEGRLSRPTKWQATQLWQTFVNNVDPFTKILHIPTAQVLVFGATNDPSETTKDTNSLLFAIFYAATTSLEAWKLSARANKAGRSLWVMNGLAIRLAQTIGLHRDGKQLNLSPFDSEMRRRLWWHLWAKDSRASEDHGITVFNTYDFSREIDFPLNVNDNELDPGMSELSSSKSRWSEMTYPLIAIKANYALQRLHFLTNPSSNKRPDTNEQTRKETIRRLTTHVEEYNQNCNPNIPIQRATMLFTRIILRKLDFVSHQQLMTKSSSSSSKLEDRKSLATEEHFISACEILELHHQIRSDDLLREFHWAFEAYPQYHLLLYTLWHLGVKTIGPNVDRAWRAKRDIITVTGPKLAILPMMRTKAMRIRQSTNSDYNGLPTGEEKPGVLQPAMNHPACSGAFDLAGHGGMSSDVMNWAAQDSVLPDWNTLIEVDMHPQAFRLEE